MNEQLFTRIFYDSVVADTIPRGVKEFTPVIMTFSSESFTLPPISIKDFASIYMFGPNYTFSKLTTPVVPIDRFEHFMNIIDTIMLELLVVKEQSVISNNPYLSSIID